MKLSGHYIILRKSFIPALHKSLTCAAGRFDWQSIALPVSNKVGKRCVELPAKFFNRMKIGCEIIAGKLLPDLYIAESNLL